MRIGIIIFVILVCAIVIIEILSLIKTLNDKRKAKKQEREKLQKSLSSWEEDVNVGEKVLDTSTENCSPDNDNNLDLKS